MNDKADNRIGIKTTRYWYNSDNTREVACAGFGDPVIFANLADAAAWIADADDTVYELSHNECARPDYRAAKVQSAWYRGELGRMRQYLPFAGQA